MNYRWFIDVGWGMEHPTRKPYPSEVRDDEWAFAAPYLILMTEEAPQCRHEPREVVNSLRFIVRGGLQRRLMPYDLPPWPVVDHQARHSMAAGVFTAIVF